MKSLASIEDNAGGFVVGDVEEVEALAGGRVQSDIV